VAQPFINLYPVGHFGEVPVIFLLTLPFLHIIDFLEKTELVLLDLIPATTLGALK
jgi:hypothetical protein